jgi:hypothetical protein
MKEISEALVQELRRKASEGASVPDLLRLLHDRLGNEAAYSTTLAKYFMSAFDLPFRAVSPIGGWAPDSSGEISDSRIQELIYPEIMRKKPLWILQEQLNSLTQRSTRKLPSRRDALPTEDPPENSEVPPTAEGTSAMNSEGN